MKKSKIFVACDTSKISKVKKIITQTKTDKIKIGYKFGLEFINSKNGRKFIAYLKKKIIFLDLKLNDIPNTCLSAIKAIKDLNINYLTIHISSGFDALKAVKMAAGKTKIVGVTTLTSLNEKLLKEIGYNKKISSLVMHQAKLARKANLDAIVCSAQEVKSVKKYFKGEIITPGIRFDKKIDDQKRIMSPSSAFKMGADWLVIGRPITKGNIKKNILNLINHLKND
tara:strand:- start:4534 stop:5211 length:678 start_codon:yes stop_codon:yes gene_type:complete